MGWAEWNGELKPSQAKPSQAKPSQEAAATASQKSSGNGGIEVSKYVEVGGPELGEGCFGEGEGGRGAVGWVGGK